jgi:hypothetical protein
LSKEGQHSTRGKSIRKKKKFQLVKLVSNHVDLSSHQTAESNRWEILSIASILVQEKGVNFFVDLWSDTPLYHFERARERESL